MARASLLARHRVALASHTALLVAVGAVVSYAMAADGFERHETVLNDGGIWVVHDEEGFYGRVNKPINQLDGVVFGEDVDVPLDVVQQGAAVVGVNERAGVARTIDPAASTLVPGMQVSLPRGAQVEMYGGTLASLDPDSGQVWAVPVDPVDGKPDITALDRQAEPAAKPGARAALAVTAGGDVVVTSAAEDSVVRLDAVAGGLVPRRSEPLPAGAGDPAQATAVGETVVTLDPSSGALQVLGGPAVQVPPGSVLQHSGPEADAVLVASSDALVEVDLGSGEVRPVTEGVSGRPAAPVRLGACVYGAWSGGLGDVAVRCGDGGTVEPETLGARASDLAFRVNRGQIVLNDGASGAVWDIDEEPARIDNWEAFTSTKLVDSDDKEDQQQAEGDRRPPKAKPDDYGVRPGRTSVLHPLDNDSAPQGRLLSIVAVDQPDLDGSQVTISPDGQTLQLSVPADMHRATSFDYHIDDGRGLDASARVTVAPRSDQQNEPPALRAGHEPRTWRVAHAGTIAVPVLANWRDDRDSDPLLVDSVQVLGGGPETADARVTPDGRVRFTAGPSRRGGATEISYTVSDGHGGTTQQRMRFDVASYDETTPYPPVAEPDVVRGEVGEPITIRPLLNDLPGADPAHPDAVLELGGEVAAQPGLEVDTDLETDEIVVRAERPGTYFLDYDAAYGNAPLDHDKIRVDVRPQPRSALDPVAMPDTLTVHGQQPAMVDVLANDTDPAGGLLVVQRAVAASDQVDVAIVEGRWLRISAADGTFDPDPQTVTYTISNGAVSGIEGQVTVVQQPEPEDATPITATDRVVVRAGSAVAAPVLDNDVSPTGSKLSLVTDVAQDGSGELDVVAPRGVADAGRAFVSGRSVRFVAPQTIAERDTVTVSYIASTGDGLTAPGQLRVTIVPAGARNHRPEPPRLDGRTVSGGEVTLRIPGSGVDPDGDAVTVTGIDSAPRLGRVVELGADGLVYEAFPGSVGTDEFDYTVTDSQGGVATGTARVVVVPPDRPQEPLAVDDRISAAPGRTVHVHAIANDFVGTGEGVEVSLQAPPPGASYDAATDLVSLQVPKDPRAPSPQVVYAVDNGLERSLATITVDVVPAHNNPPVVYDAYGVADDSEAVSLDVLEGAYDPDGPVSDLRVVEVFHPTATHTSSRIKVARSDAPQVVPFRVEDADGGSAVASLYVPATGTAVPYVKEGAFLEVGTNGRVRGELDDYVVNPSGGPMRLAGPDAALAAPEQASARVVDDRTFELSGTSDYIGPGALLLRVTTTPPGEGADDPDTTRDGVTTLLTVPAQIGRPKPELQCPDVAFEVVQDDEITLDVPSLCNVFTADPDAADDLSYEVAWTDEPAGLALNQPAPGRVVVAASGGARAGTEALLVVRAGDSEPEQIRVRVTSAPDPDLLPIRLPALEPGETRTVDLAQYLVPGVSDPEPTLVSVEKVSGPAVSAEKTGRAQVTLRGGPEGGRVAFRVVMSDVADADPAAGRLAEGRLELEVGAVPDAPTGVVAHDFYPDASTLAIYFEPPDDNGSPITRYVVETVGGGRQYDCRKVNCPVDGLDPGKEYSFRIAAINRFGRGPWSERSQGERSGYEPTRPRAVRLVGRDADSITVAWSEPKDTGGSPIKGYLVTIGGKEAKVDGSTFRATVDGLSGSRQHPVSVRADNDSFKSDPADHPGWWVLGVPAAPTGVKLSDTPLSSGEGADVTVGWNAVTRVNGPPPVRYSVEVSTDGGPYRPLPGCTDIEALSCTDAGVEYDGARHAYRVLAANSPATDNPGGGEAPGRSNPSETAVFQAIGTPAQWGTVDASATGRNNELQVRAIVPDSRGEQSRVTVEVSGGETWTSDRLDEGEVLDRTFATGTNYQPSTVTVRLCNEQERCSSRQSEAAQSYGPLTGDHLRAAAQPPQQGDQSARWAVYTDGNGRPVTLHWRVNGGAAQSQPRGDSPETQVIQFDTGGHNRTADLDVWVTDAAPGVSRDRLEESEEARSGQPGPIGVTVSVGARCGADTGVACDGRDNGNLFNDCNNVPCHNVDINVSNWWNDPSKSDDGVSCEANWSGSFNDDFERTFAANGSHVLYSYPRDGGTVSVTCETTNDDVDQSGSGSQAWPDDPDDPGPGGAARWGP